MSRPNPRTAPATRRLRAGAAVLLAGALAVGGAACAAGGPDGPHDSRPETVTVTGTAAGPPVVPDPTRPAPAPPAPTPPGEGQSHPDLTVLVAAVTAEFGGTAGVVISDGASTLSAGELSTGPAWSTVKVPIAVAALRSAPDLVPVVEQAISASDNDAAQTLWATLGSPEQAGAATGRILAEGGDRTAVNTVVTRPEFSSFGQTAWALADQATFAAHLPCLRGAEPVISAMGAVVPGQDYGLGAVPGARYKGGWGPDETGAYLVRQFGVLLGEDGGHRAVAIAARPASGTYGDGQAMLTRLAEGLGSAAGDIPAARC